MGFQSHTILDSRSPITVIKKPQKQLSLTITAFSITTSSRCARIYATACSYRGKVNNHDTNIELYRIISLLIVVTKLCFENPKTLCNVMIRVSVKLIQSPFSVSALLQCPVPYFYSSVCLLLRSTKQR